MKQERLFSPAAAKFSNLVLCIGCLSAFTLLTACSTVDYDDQADQQLTSLSKEIDLQFTTWAHQTEATPPSPANYDASFYDKVEADINTLRIRMEASPSYSNEALAPVFSSLGDQVESVRKLHESEKAFADFPFLHAEQSYLDAQIASLVTYELSLKSSGVGSNKKSDAATSRTKAAATDAKSKVNNASHKTALP